MTQKTSPFRAVFGAVLIVAVIGLTITTYPDRRKEGLRAVQAEGYRVDTFESSWFDCAKGRYGFRWTSGAVRGKVCVGGWMSPIVTVF